MSRKIIRVFLVLVLLISFSFQACEYSDEPINKKDYDVVYVNPYIKTITNQFGGNVQQELAIAFVFLNEEGEAITVMDKYYDTEIINVCYVDKEYQDKPVPRFSKVEYTTHTEYTLYVDKSNFINK